MSVFQRASTVLLLATLVGTPLHAKKDKAQKDNAAKPSVESAEIRTAAPATTDVIAYVGETPITRQEVERAAPRLRQIRNAEYEIIRQALDGIVQQKLLEKEALARNVTVLDLVKTEIEAKVSQPTPSEVDAFYERNKVRYRNRPKEEIGAQLEQDCRAEKRSERNLAFLTELRQKTDLRVLLEPPRIHTPVPQGEPSRGPENAPVTLVEFADFQCPYCRRAHPTIEQLLSEYGDRIRYVFRDFPLSNHPRAIPASEAARCAGDQGKYWQYYDSLMEVTGDLGDNDLNKRATDLGLDITAFTACLASDRHEAAIRTGFDDGNDAGVTGTPSFFINGRMIVGAKPIEEFKAIIEEELTRAGAGKASMTGTSK